jgi:hypothetical protein
VAGSLQSALRAANKALDELLRPTYFSAIPLDRIYDSIEGAGLSFELEDKECILCGREGRASWNLLFADRPIKQTLWITWHKMTTDRYEVIAAVT